MATAAPAGPPQDQALDITVDLFARMVEQGVFPRERRVYLEDGRLREKPARTRAHGSVGGAITMTIARRLPPGWGIWPESTIVLDNRNAPLPDLTVLRSAGLQGRADCERYPEPGDIGLLIEIAVSSLRKDLTTSPEKYARAAIPAYWVVDVLGRRILAHSETGIDESGRGLYARVETYLPGQSLPLVLDGREVALIPFDDLLR
jgi:Uma2 family endonuclease